MPSNYQHINFDSRSDNIMKNIELESNGGTTTQKLQNLESQYIKPLFEKPSYNYELNESNGEKGQENRNLDDDGL